MIVMMRMVMVARFLEGVHDLLFAFEVDVEGDGEGDADEKHEREDEDGDVVLGSHHAVLLEAEVFRATEHFSVELVLDLEGVVAWLYCFDLSEPCLVGARICRGKHPVHEPVRSDVHPLQTFVSSFILLPFHVGPCQIVRSQHHFILILIEYSYVIFMCHLHCLPCGKYFGNSPHGFATAFGSKGVPSIEKF